MPSNLIDDDEDRDIDVNDAGVNTEDIGGANTDTIGSATRDIEGDDEDQPDSDNPNDFGEDETEAGL